MYDNHKQFVQWLDSNEHYLNIHQKKFMSECLMIHFWYKLYFSKICHNDRDGCVLQGIEGNDI